MRYNQIKTFEDACKVNGVKPADVLPYKSKRLSPDQVSQNAYAKLVQIVRAINGKKWKADFDNGNQVKNYPFWYKATDGFSFGSVRSRYQHSSVGSRLCFESSNKCEYAAKQFVVIYNEYML